jgi:hypothetical protein
MLVMEQARYQRSRLHMIQMSPRDKVRWGLLSLIRPIVTPRSLSHNEAISFLEVRRALLNYYSEVGSSRCPVRCTGRSWAKQECPGELRLHHGPRNYNAITMTSDKW